MATKYSKGSDAAGPTGKDCLVYRPSKSDIGSVVRPPGAPGPESKGSIAPIREAGDVRNPPKTG